MSGRKESAEEVAARIGSAAIAGAGDFWMRALEIGVRYATAATGKNAGPLSAMLAELALVPGLAFDRFVGGFDAAPAPPSHAATWTIEGCPFRLPARIGDSAQGFALYAVSIAAAQQALGGARAPVVAVDIGRGRAAFQLFASDYRDSDFGVCAELGAAFLVRPRTGRGGLGMFIVDLPVGGRFACEAGKRIWGFAKRVAPLAFSYTREEATCTLGGRAVAVTIRFPRGTGAASTSVPVPSYTILDGRLTRTVFRRTGRDERLFPGGAARVAIGGSRRAEDRLARLLRGLEVPSASPVLSGWTEHMSGEFGPPVRAA
jgi:hypothetical protein